MSLVQAQHIRGLNGFPFPFLARNIYYAGYADWIHHETLICFDAPQKDCEAALPQIIQWSIGSSKNSYPTVPLEREVHLPAPDRQFLPSVKWWDDVIVKHGSFTGEDSSNKPQVWIDGDLGRVYYYETD